jgi:outer membrane biosynthesis protein TonB
VKSANVKLVGYENSKGGGLITVKFEGDVGAVRAAVSAGTAAANRVGKVSSTLVIPRPHTEIRPLVGSLTRGPGLPTEAVAAAPAPVAPVEPEPEPAPAPEPEPEPDPEPEPAPEPEAPKSSRRKAKKLASSESASAEADTDQADTRLNDNFLL